MRATYVIVTFNRLELLKKTLKSALNMTKKFNDVIIVNNNSSDGTTEYLNDLIKNEKNIKVFHLENNIGGAGGFSFGVQKAIELTDNDWIFLADDDAIPDKDMLLNLEKGFNSNEDKENIAAVCTSVYNGGVIDTNHRNNIIKSGQGISIHPVEKDAYVGSFYVDGATFVGLMIKSEIVKKIGIPDASYFIYHDDAEYCIRINKEGKILCVSDAVMNHDVSHNVNNILTWRDYYIKRNYLYMIIKHFGKKYCKLQLKMYRRRYSFIRKFIKKVPDNERRLLKTAVYDALKGRMGIHHFYNPSNKNI